MNKISTYIKTNNEKINFFNTRNYFFMFKLNNIKLVKCHKNKNTKKILILNYITFDIT